MGEPYVIIPFFNALVYTLGALCAKRSTVAGVGPWRTTFAMNIGLGLAALPFWFFGDPLDEWSDLIGPFVVSLCFFTGQLLGILAIHKGDVSVVTPLMGVKAVVVGLLALILIEEPQSGGALAGAALSAVAIFLIRGETHAERKRLFPSIVLGLACASSFALSDIFVQRYGISIGWEKMAAIAYSFTMLWSLSLIPFFRGSIRSVDRTTLRWLFGGSALMAAQALGMTYVLSEYGKATIVNVVYSSRGLWSIVLVWVIGHWFGNLERKRGGGVMGRRLTGAAILVAAIYLALR